MSTPPLVPAIGSLSLGSDMLTWLGIDKETFLAGLRQRFPDVPGDACDSVGSRLLDLHPLLRLAFRIWWETGKIPDLGSISGYTVHDLQTGSRGTPPFQPTRVFLTLDALIADPEKAKVLLAQPIHGFIPATGKDHPLPPRFTVKQRSLLH